MKGLILFVTLLLFTIFEIRAQKVSFNFKDKTITGSLEDLKRGDYYNVEITNINMNLYKVSINNSDTTLESGLTLPSFGSFGTDALSSLLSSLSKLGGATSVLPANATSETLKEMQMNRSFHFKKENYPMVGDKNKNDLDSVLRVKVEIETY